MKVRFLFTAGLRDSCASTKAMNKNKPFHLCATRAGHHVRDVTKATRAYQQCWRSPSMLSSFFHESLSKVLMERPQTAHSSESTSRKEDDENSNEFTAAENRPASRRGTRTAQQRVTLICSQLPRYVSALTQNFTHIFVQRFSGNISSRRAHVESRFVDG